MNRSAAMSVAIVLLGVAAVAAVVIGGSPGSPIDAPSSEPSLTGDPAEATDDGRSPPPSSSSPPSPSADEPADSAGGKPAPPATGEPMTQSESESPARTAGEQTTSTGGGSSTSAADEPADSAAGDPPETRASATSGSPATTTTTAVPAETDPFALRVVDVSSCGLSCRDVTVALTNEADTPVDDVVVRSDVIAGDRVIVERTDEVGHMAPSETVERTVRVSVGFADLSAIQANGGYVTIETTVESDQFDQTFTTRERVL